MPESTRRNVNFPRANLFMLGVITFIMLGATLKLTTAILLPFVIAVLLTFVLEPLINLLTKIKIPRALAAIVVVLAIASALYVVGLVLFNSVKTIATLYPKYEERFTEIYQLLANAFSLPYDEHLNLFDNIWQQMGVRQQIQSWALNFSNSFIGFFSDSVMVVLFIVFLLLELGHFKARVELAFANTFPGGVKAIIDSIVRQVTRYLSVKFIMSLATGLIIGLVLKLIGMDFPVVWAVICFILNFIPTIGSIGAGMGVVIFAVVQFYPAPTPIIIAALTAVLTNMIIGNIIEPKIQGDNLGLSPFVILLSLLIWGWLWGFAGLILAVPMTVIIKIICEQVPILEPVSILMGSYKAAISTKARPARWYSAKHSAQKSDECQDQQPGSSEPNP
ncbi:MAG: AI-2E family transporter [Spirochaetes bacterium]|nr:AI-2E family transporter [Spirochaetota bacterium]MBU0954240.1 AI-2E family transporter [Spirochaetota bacterium]